MTRVVTLASNTYTAGVRSFGSTVIPNGLATIGIELSRDSWPVTATVAFALDLSMDNGTTWVVPFIAFTASGGVVSGVGGTVVKSKVVINLPSGTQRRMRGSVTFSETITTEAAVEIN